jgi:hypothetical protein
LTHNVAVYCGLAAPVSTSAVLNETARSAR